MKNSEKRSIAKECFRAGKQREIRFFAGLLAIWAILSVFLLMHGDESYSLQTVLRVLLGEDIRGAAYAVRTIRVPRVLVGTLAGFAFGIAGNTFQKIMRNSLASPDVMGVTTGASAAAIVSMMVWNLDGLQTELLAMAGGICAASVILLPAARRRDAVNKMILTGIGIQAMLQAVINFVILKTSDYDVSAALRWLSGSLNGARMKDVPLLGGIVLLCTAVILALSREQQLLGLGEELPVLLGMRAKRSRMLLIYSAVILCSGAAAVTGPLSSVAFMSGPIAARILKTGGTGALHAGMTGAVIVLLGEAAGQFAFSTRYPVGVITGIIGAPYLIYLLMRMNRKAG
ncbi:iron chelate uptake ABC transporter, FeCT family, permease protein [Marvinbryantia formatexigens DSM 14469]|uniref:Iron chelate uptake ABC transporter, FeCT family, permease protein n=1 Tax=Marvinbryantia formatexigens DSM 14469 TaxID=478749 RepID=C6LGU5_9FIRM|nr:iron ABC transporter permease [Marvinbryantia formatexigens]EET60295.1 iron chelate uptake ABC transporter, FeCT family, permease protein [Marvinbryantia formatexigens DSM 14469]UWO24311.1 iron ABC transporter permease [Marvinbryantia formatexigens DSM 14469]SDF54773.1 iron complex transport system permease protein [Marvinbryantia formatexigens]